MEKKFTPGPWFLTDSYMVLKMPEEAIIVSWGSISGATSEESRANANLIAAAPELLEGLEWLLDALEKMVALKPVRDLDERYLFIKNAIRKAHGNQ